MVRSPPLPQKEASDRRILVVEDDRDMRHLLWRLLPAHGWQVTTAGDGLTALDLLENHGPFGACLADYRIPGPNGRRVIEHARLMNPDCLCVLYGGYLPHDAKEWAKENRVVTVRKGATESVALLLTALEDAHA